MIASNTKRPRNVDAPRAAAILYGDWGTSKAYVVGLAFAVAGYSSFWLVLAMCVLTALVGVNYMAICKHYPDGGGVYASVRHRSEIISIVGAFLLVADYIVTAAISALSAFQYIGHYFGIPHPEYWAAGSIVFIGALNFFGPKHTGGLAFLVSLPTVVVVVLLGLFCLPHLGQAVHNIQPLTGGFFKNWNGFVGVVLALSGVEAIANATGVMKLNPGSTDAKPCVSKTSSRAIIWVMIEVCAFTALLALGMHALPNLVISPDPTNPDVNAAALGNIPASAGVRDYMLGYLAQVFVGQPFGLAAGHIAAIVVSLVFAGLLLSAVNTAIVDLIAISFLMSRDGELPSNFQKLNRFGVPNLSIIIATIVPATLLLIVSDVSGLADLYAVGVVGAIATNLGASSTDKHLGLARWERGLMFCTFLIMLAIELSLFIDKPGARFFAGSVLVIGLFFRGLANTETRRKVLITATLMALGISFALVWSVLHGRILAVTLLAVGLVFWALAGERARNKAKAIAAAPVSGPAAATTAQVPIHFDSEAATGSAMMCAVRGTGKTLDFAIEEAKEAHRPLYLLFVRSLPALTEQDTRRKWPEDEEARKIFDEAKIKAGTHPVFPCYAVSDSVADTIVDIAATVGVTHLVLGAPERRGLVSLLSGNIVRQIAALLPEDVHLLVYA